MGETKDYSRQRLSDFLAARLRASQGEANEAQRASQSAGPTSSPRPEEIPPHAPRPDDSSLRKESLDEQKRYPPGKNQLKNSASTPVYEKEKD
jgi:hypothetical protein